MASQSGMTSQSKAYETSHTTVELKLVEERVVAIIYYIYPPAARVVFPAA